MNLKIPLTVFAEDGTTLIDAILTIKTLNFYSTTLRVHGVYFQGTIHEQAFQTAKDLLDRYPGGVPNTERDRVLDEVDVEYGKMKGGSQPAILKPTPVQARPTAEAPGQPPLKSPPKTPPSYAVYGGPKAPPEVLLRRPSYKDLKPPPAATTTSYATQALPVPQALPVSYDPESPSQVLPDLLGDYGKAPPPTTEIPMLIDSGIGRIQFRDWWDTEYLYHILPNRLYWFLHGNSRSYKESWEWYNLLFVVVASKFRCSRSNKPMSMDDHHCAQEMLRQTEAFVRDVRRGKSMGD